MRALMSDQQTSVRDIAETPRVAAVAVEFPPHRHDQDEAIATLAGFAGQDFRRFAASAGVRARHLALPMHRYAELSGFSEANDAFIDIAVELAERSLLNALGAAGLQP